MRYSQLLLRGLRASASRAARTNALILAGSFSPGPLSTPDDTSTPGARVIASASATLSGIEPPGKHEGQARIKRFQQLPVERPAEPTRPGGLSRRARIEQKPVGDARIGLDPLPDRIAVSTGDRLHDRQPEFRASASKPAAASPRREAAACRASEQRRSASKVASSASTVSATFPALPFTRCPKLARVSYLAHAAETARRTQSPRNRRPHPVRRRGLGGFQPAYFNEDDIGTVSGPVSSASSAACLPLGRKRLRHTSIAAAKSSIAVPTDLNSVIWAALWRPFSVAADEPEQVGLHIGLCFDALRASAERRYRPPPCSAPARVSTKIARAA